MAIKKDNSGGKRDKTKTYTKTIPSNIQKEQIDYMNSEELKL